MLKLENISKYYTKNGAVALGLRRINTTFQVGEFVAIVGESGSGKSTLLNVLSGLDSYEEGEFYINGEQTSHYTVEDWEHYRKNYIGFVFQNYNIIESYTVLQNVESALILSGYSPQNRRKRALEIIDRVGLTPFKNMKTSKLSGGQMQRTVIARALAKDCQIIACDEPTGNLDSETSKQIMELLREVSKDKLVLIVTHNYKEVEDIATRKVTLHDGQIVEDQILKETLKKKLVTISDTESKVTYKDRLLMSLQNILATPVKTFLLFMVLWMLTIGSAFIYGSQLNFKDEQTQANQNRYFQNSMKERIILRNKNFSVFSDEEMKQLNEISGVKDIVTGDVALDQKGMTLFPIDKSQYSVYASIMPNSLILKKNLIGKMPSIDDEVVINTNALRDGVKKEDLLNHTFSYTIADQTYSFKIVGITENKKLGEILYLNHNVLNEISDNYLGYYKKFTYEWNGIKDIPFIPIELKEQTLKEDEVAVNTAFLTASGLEEENLIGHMITIQISSLYHTEVIPYKIIQVVQNSYLGELPTIYFNTHTLTNLKKDSDTYQVSIITDSYTQAKRVLHDLDHSHYEIFYPYGTLDQTSYLIYILNNLFYGAYLVFFIGIFFFITYFIVRNIMASKRNDYIILRSIGATKKLIKQIIFFELLEISIFSYIVTLILLLFSHYVTIRYVSDAILKIFNYYLFIDYVYILGIIIILVFFLTRRFNKKLFSTSVMLTFKGEE